MLELREMWRTTSLPSLPGPLRFGVVAPACVLCMGLIELFDIYSEYYTNDLCLVELLEIELFDFFNCV